MVTTSHSSYYLPAKPYIAVYKRSDSTYTTPLFEYDPFTAAPSDPNKPSRIIFDSSLSNAGQFAITLENNDDNLNPDDFQKSNRVVIELSKDNVTWRKVFKGLIRRTVSSVFADNPQDRGKNLTFEGFSYLIRHGERLLNVVKESAKVAPGGETDPYDRTDSTMFTNTLVNNLLSADVNYLAPNGQDDTQLYSINLINNTASSPITTWVPIVNAEYATLDEAISRVLEFSNSYIMLNPENDQLYIYNPDNPTTDVQAFLLTTTPNKNADDADVTMYPDQPYDYSVGYDYPDYGNKIGVSYKDPRTNVGEDLVDIPDCPDAEVPGSEPSPLIGDAEPSSGDWFSEGVGDCRIRATTFTADSTPFTGFRTVLMCQGNVSSHDMRARIHSWSAGSIPGSSVGSDMIIYRNADDTLLMPTATTAAFMVGLPDGVNGPALTPGNNYWIALRDLDSNSSSIRIGWNYWANNVSGYGDAFNECSTYPGSGWILGDDGPHSKYVLKYATAGTTIPGCAGFQEASVNFDRRVAAMDRVSQKKTILVERAFTGLPPGTHTAQTINEYLYAKLYTSTKPRFQYVFPSVTIPSKYPKAGDLVTHIDPYNKVGTQFDPIQIGMVSDARYEFGTDEKNRIGLRKLSLTTTGIRKGYY